MSAGTVLRQHCRDYTDRRVAQLRAALTSVRTARAEDTKSSAGDKFETGRERLQAEEDKLTAQLTRVLRDREVLALLARPAAHPSGTAGLGSAVRTDGGHFYLSIAAGRVTVAGEEWFCVSMDSPVGRALHGARSGDRVALGERELLVESVTYD